MTRRQRDALMQRLEALARARQPVDPPPPSLRVLEAALKAVQRILAIPDDPRREQMLALLPRLERTIAQLKSSASHHETDVNAYAEGRAPAHLLATAGRG